MKLFFSLVLLLMCLTCCVDKKQEFKTLSKVDNDNRHIEQSSIKSDNQIGESGQCRVSQEMKEIISLLEKNNYYIDSTPTQNTLKFKAYEDLQLTKEIEFDNQKFNSFLAKRKTKLAGLKDNLYPRFTVYEICFDDEKLASTYEQELKGILSSPDIFNEKNYDYLIRHKARIIYVSCGAKIFEQYALDYKESIEEILDN